MSELQQQLLNHPGSRAIVIEDLVNFDLVVFQGEEVVDVGFGALFYCSIEAVYSVLVHL